MVNKLREKRERERIDLEFNLLVQAFIYETDKIANEFNSDIQKALKHCFICDKSVEYKNEIMRLLPNRCHNS